MSRNVQITRRRGFGSSWCDECDMRPDKTREAVRQHVDRTGHVAHYLIEDTTTYKKKTPTGKDAAPEEVAP